MPPEEANKFKIKELSLLVIQEVKKRSSDKFISIDVSQYSDGILFAVQSAILACDFRGFVVLGKENRKIFYVKRK